MATMSHQTQVIAATVDLIRSFDDWFIVEFVHQLLKPEQYPDAFEASFTGALGAKRWLIDWASDIERDVTALEGIFDVFRRKHLAAIVMKHVFKKDYAHLGITDADASRSMELNSDLRLAGMRDNVHHFDVQGHYMVYHNDDRVAHIVQSQMWLKNDDVDAMPILIVRCNMDTAHVQVMLSIERIHLAEYIFESLWDKGYIKMSEPDVVASDFCTDLHDFAARTIPGSMNRAPRVIVM